MRAFLTAAAIAAIVVAGLPAGAAEFVPPGEEFETTPGSIALPTRFPDTADPGNVSAGYPGLIRRVYQASAATNGVIGFVIDIDPETWGGAFVLGDVTDQTGAGNLDVYFYKSMGDVGGQEAPVTVAEYSTADKGETGFIPADANKAIVFTPDAINSTFNFTTYLAPVVSIGKTSLDLTVPAGATVEWLNSTTDYTFVRHVPASGKALFDSSPKAGTGLGVGESFSHQFDTVGTYTYQTSTGTGTITVIEGPGVGTPAG